MFVSLPPPPAIPDHATIPARRAFFNGQVLQGTTPTQDAEMAREVLAMSREDAVIPSEVLAAAARFPYGNLMATRRRVLAEKPDSAQAIINAQTREIRVLNILVNRGKLSRALLTEGLALLETAEHVQRALESEDGRDVAGASLHTLAERYGDGQKHVEECAAALLSVIQKTVHRFNRWTQ